MLFEGGPESVHAAGRRDVHFFDDEPTGEIAAAPAIDGDIKARGGAGRPEKPRGFFIGPDAERLACRSAEERV
jgi:hypothetical protein